TLLLQTGFAFDLKQNERNNPLQIESVTVTSPLIQEGDRVSVFVDVKIDKDFYVYDDKAKLFPLEPDGMQIGGLQMTPTIEFVDFSGQRHTGLREHARLQFFAEIPAQLDHPLSQI